VRFSGAKVSYPTLKGMTGACRAFKAPKKIPCNTPQGIDLETLRP